RGPQAGRARPAPHPPGGRLCPCRETADAAVRRTGNTAQRLAGSARTGKPHQRPAGRGAPGSRAVGQTARRGPRTPEPGQQPDQGTGSTTQRAGKAAFPPLIIASLSRTSGRQLSRLAYRDAMHAPCRRMMIIDRIMLCCNVVPHGHRTLAPPESHLLFDQLSDIERKGYASSVGSLHPNVLAIAAPTLDAAGMLAGAGSVTTLEPDARSNEPLLSGYVIAAA